MRLITFRLHASDRELRIGIIHGARVIELPEWRGDMKAFLAAGPTAMAQARHAEASGFAAGGINLAEIVLAAPVANPGKILAIGRNYREHAKEMGSAAPAGQVWFNKQANAANGPDAPVEMPAFSQQLDYEGELVLIIGRHCRNVPEGRAMEVIAGFCVGCDFSVRDWQRAAPTMIAGKGFPTHAPFGPAIVTPDEAGDPAAMRIETRVNGEIRQSAQTDDMAHTIPAQIAFLTRVFALGPGDVIFTGTPAGVGAGRDPPEWLQVGDRVEVEIANFRGDSQGRLSHSIISGPELPMIL